MAMSFSMMTRNFNRETAKRRNGENVRYNNGETVKHHYEETAKYHNGEIAKLHNGETAEHHNRETASHHNGEITYHLNGETTSHYNGEITYHLNRETASHHNAGITYHLNGETASHHNGETASYHNGETASYHNGETASHHNGETASHHNWETASRCSGVTGSSTGHRDRYDNAWNSKYAEMDIMSGHLVLSYMESHLRNENKLRTEWKALCNYEPEKCTIDAGLDQLNVAKNRYTNILPYDHTRVELSAANNPQQSDYINASFIADTNPRKPIYIATQGPLEETVVDFWQMVWENNVVVIVNLTQLSDQGLSKCCQYWPTDGSAIHHIYKLQLISEHKWCDEYVVRNFYMKNLQTNRTRSVTQFQYLTWPDLGVPFSPHPVLEFRRKINKCYRGHLGGPIVVHCNNGVGRTGTYILLDMVLNRLIKGAKEIDIAATLEHVRDQRPGCVTTKVQFEFVLLALAQEVSSVVDALVMR